MNIEQKNHIITRFLQGMGETPVDIPLEKLADYTQLSQALDFLENNTPDLLNFETIEADPREWEIMKDILFFGIEFTADTPPAVATVSISKLTDRIEFWHRERQLAALPQHDYYHRHTELVASDEVNELIASSRLKMKPLIESFLIKGSVFNPANNEHVKTITDLLKARLNKVPKHSEEYQLTEKKLAILDDLNKINQLTVLAIPHENTLSKLFCSLAESAGGVTEKISLVSLAKVREQLTHLSMATIEMSSIENYTKARSNFKLSTEAILKLPKHGDIKEVQREAIALNISRMLGLDTTRSTMITHRGQPALFVPFDNIRLLKDYAKGKTLKATGFSGQTYEHYSTINPVGNGLQGDTFVDDFGASLGLFYLCSDTDAVGGYNQNKALRDDHSLFIFDQVMMSKDKLGLDSRLSMQPIEFLLMHTRHGQGRNRTLIEDSSMNSKFASIMALKQQQQLLLQYADRIIYFHKERINELKARLKELPLSEKKPLEAELKQVTLLTEDAALLKTIIEHRIAAIETVLPKHEETITENELRQSLVLEKLLHNPVLFSAEGRPFKNPWTHRHNNPVKTISELDESHLVITFGSKIKDDMVNFLKRHGGTSLRKRSDKELIISRTDLARLNEAMLHPEYQLSIDHLTNYLDKDDLIMISSAYGEGHRGKILTAIEQYQAAKNSPDTTIESILTALNQTEAALLHCIHTAKDPGFGSHVMKKFHFDAQQTLQRLMQPEQKPVNLDNAFAAALKLDRVNEFNQVIKSAIKTGRLTSLAFTEFLSDCIQKAALATNHREAVNQSLALRESASRAVNTFLQPEMAAIIHVQPIVHEDQEDELADIDPLLHRQTELQEQRDLMVGLPEVSIQEEGSQSNAEENKGMRTRVN